MENANLEFFAHPTKKSLLIFQKERKEINFGIVSLIGKVASFKNISASA